MGGPNTNTERTNGLRLWRAGCVETRTSGSEGGLGKPTEGNPGHGVPVRPYTQHWTLEGWLYLSVAIDVYAGTVVGWSMSERIDTSLVISALEMAVHNRQPAPGVIHHSDQGRQGGFKWSSQHLGCGGARWASRGSRCLRFRLGRGASGRQIGRYDRRCGHRGGRSRRVRCSVSSGA